MLSKGSRLIIVMLFLIMGIAFILFKLPVSREEGFAIYLTEKDIPPSQMEALSHVDIASKPIISNKDIISYDAQTHELILTTTAFERISNLEVPVRGKSFLVCVNKSPLYWGAFWTPVSSLSFDGAIIMKPMLTQKADVITISLGYPTLSAFSGIDPRNNKNAFESLNQEGKLINKP